MLNRLREFIAEALFPPFCISCKRNGDWWCQECRAKTEIITTNACPACLLLTHHETCHGSSPLDGISPAGFYHDPQLRNVIWSIKYRGGTCLLPLVSAFFHDWTHARRAPWPWAGVSSASIVSVHTSPRRVRERGFDQADLLAEAVGNEIVPWATHSNLLMRVKEVPAQASIEPGPLRAANVRQIFCVAENIPIPENVILVDDVATSGATLAQAAATLKEAGVKRVYAVVLAIGT